MRKRLPESFTKIRSGRLVVMARSIASSFTAASSLRLLFPDLARRRFIRAPTAADRQMRKTRPVQGMETERQAKGWMTDWAKRSPAEVAATPSRARASIKIHACRASRDQPPSASVRARKARDRLPRHERRMHVHAMVYEHYPRRVQSVLAHVSAAIHDIEWERTMLCQRDHKQEYSGLERDETAPRACLRGDGGLENSPVSSRTRCGCG